MRPVSSAVQRPVAFTQAVQQPTVRWGSRGPAVADLQRRLGAAGFSPGPVDGVFGPKTNAAVVAFQRARGLEVDGIVGPKTWGALLRGGAQPPPRPAPVTPVGNLPRSGNAFIDSVAAGAVASDRKYGVPASVTIAQAILESGWGRSGLTRSANNLFGIKGTGPAGSVRVQTQEYVNGGYITVYANFRKYHTLAESMDDHGRLLATSSYYRRAMAVKNDANAFARALNGVYATSPTYADNLIKIMRQYDLYRYDRA